MTDDLYRKEALQHRSRSLYGEVVLTAPPASWIITLILVCVMCLLIGLLIGVDIENQPLWRWLLKVAS